MVQLSHPYIMTVKIHSFEYMYLCHKVMSLLLNMMSMLVIVFFQGASKRCLLFRRKAMINLDSVLKSRDYFADKGLYNQSYGFFQ